MTENFATQLIIRRDPTGPEGLITGPYLVSGINALVSRVTETSIQKRDFWRAMTQNTPVISRHRVGWEFEVGDSQVFDTVMDALADPGRSSVESGAKVWRFGRPLDVARFDFLIDPVEGGHFEALGCACSSAQLVMDRGRIGIMTTQWVARQLSTDDTSLGFASEDNSAFAAAPDFDIVIGDIETTIMSAAIAFNRPIEAAQFVLEGVATEWTGSQSLDILGRFVCRLPSGNFGSLLQGGIIDAPLTISFTAGARQRIIDIPAVRMQTTSRTFVTQGTYEYLIEFASIKIEGQDLATITSVSV
jgi:hypothetical protein